MAGNKASFSPLNTIWDSDKINRSVNTKGDALWQCLHCTNCKLSGINAMEALLYVLKI